MTETREDRKRIIQNMGLKPNMAVAVMSPGSVDDGQDTVVSCSADGFVVTKQHGGVHPNQVYRV